MEWSTVRQRWAAPAVLLACHLSGILLFLLHGRGAGGAGVGFPLDDAWIHLVYGRALVTEGGPFYNPGYLTTGFSSPLWMLACGLAELLGRVPGVGAPLALCVLGVACAFGTSLGIHRLALRWTGSRTAALFSGVLCASSPLLAFAQVSGMEVMLAAATSTWTLVALDDGRHRAAGWWLCAALLSRPEALLLFGLLGVLVVTCWGRRVFRERRADTLRLLLPAILGGLLWVGFCLAVSGYPLPNTFYAKAEGGALGAVLTLVHEVLLRRMAATGLIGGVLLFVAGVVWLARSRRDPAVVGVLLWPWVLLAGVALSRPMPSGSVGYFYWMRYVLPAVPLLLLPIGIGAFATWTSSARLARVRIGPVRMGPVATVLGVASALALVPLRLVEESRLFGQSCRNVEEVQVAAGRWLAESTPDEAVVFAHDAGAARYFGGRRVVDVIGLNDHDLVHDPDLRRAILTDAGALVAAMDERNARWLVIFPVVFRHLVEQPLFRRELVPRLALRSPTYVLSPDPRQDLLVVFERLPPLSR